MSTNAEMNCVSQRGLSLVDLLMFIVIVSVSIAGILSVMNLVTSNSADPMLRKQAVAIAESMLEEITLHQFTYCDPDDPKAGEANQPSDCNTVQGFAKTAGEDRIGALAAPFDNVGDYAGFTMKPIVDISGDAVAGLGAFQVNVTVGPPSVAIPSVAASEIAEIAVRVTGPGGTDVTLTGYRFRYAPQALP